MQRPSNGSFLLSKSPAFSLLFRAHVQSQRPAGIADVVRVEVLFERTDHVHARRSNLLLQPGPGLLANAVVVADGCAGILHRIQDAVLQLQILIDLADARDEDEIQISALRVGM